MKTLIVMALAGAALTFAARYFKITSWNQVKEIIPELTSMVPKVKKMMTYN